MTAGQTRERLVLLMALGLTRSLSGVTAADPLAYIAAPLALGAAAYLACAVPARSAASVDPSIALREE